MVLKWVDWVRVHFDDESVDRAFEQYGFEVDDTLLPHGDPTSYDTSTFVNTTRVIILTTCFGRHSHTRTMSDSCTYDDVSTICDRHSVRQSFASMSEASLKYVVKQSWTSPTQVSSIVEIPMSTTCTSLLLLWAFVLSLFIASCPNLSPLHKQTLPLSRQRTRSIIHIR
jgi:hypothetical protein